MRQGKEIVVHGDGTSLWTLTHHEDFAKGFVPLLGHPRTVGDSFHITSDECADLEPDRRGARRGAGVVPRIVHVPSDAIAAADPEWGAGLLGDKAHSMIFDNSKLRSVVPDYVATIPFERGRPRDRRLARRGPGAAGRRRAPRRRHGPTGRRAPAVARRVRFTNGFAATAGILDLSAGAAL